MARRILVVPVTDGAGVTAACLGLAQALDARRVCVAYAKPFEQLPEHGYDQSTERMETMTRTFTVRGECRVIGAVINRLPPRRSAPSPAASASGPARR